MIHAWFEEASDEELIRAAQNEPQVLELKLRSLFGEERSQILANELSRLGSLSKTGSGNDNLPEIILLPGIMGTNLTYLLWGFRNLLWIDGAEFLRGNLAERLSLAEDGITDKMPTLKIRPRNPVQLIYRFPKLAWKSAGIVVNEFGYDWRTPIKHIAKKLNLYIENLLLDQPDRKFVLVGHSMGGVIVAEYGAQFEAQMNKHVKNAVLMGTPLAGAYSPWMAINGKHDILTNLASFVANDSVPDYQRMATTLPGLVNLLPNPEIFRDMAPYYQESSWQTGFAPKQRWLDETSALNLRIRSSPILERSHLLVTTHLSTQGSITEKEICGDGTVANASSIVEGTCGAYKTTVSHTFLPWDPIARDAVRDIVRGEQPNAEPAAIECDLKAASATLAKSTQPDTKHLEELRSRFRNGTETSRDIFWLMGEDEPASDPEYFA